MNPRENALRIVRFDQPACIVENFPNWDISYFGVHHDPFEGVGGHNVPVGTRWRDIWGVGWQKELEGVMGYAREHPLADLTQIEHFAFPDPDDERICGRVYQRAREASEADRANKFLLGSHRETLWERCYNLVGMDRLMMAFIDTPDLVRQLLNRVMDFQLGIARHYLAVGIEVAHLGDDLGSQRAPLFSPDMLREFFVPEYRRLVGLYKQHGVTLNFHSCGHVEPILEVFMDLGIDVLNPVQASANDLDRVRARTAGRLALMGGVSTATLVNGPLEAIRHEARLRLWQLGRDGGYFCGPDQYLPFPPDHIAVLRQTVADFGRYPLKPPPPGN